MLNKWGGKHINEGEPEKRRRDLEIREEKRSVDDDERIL